MGMFCNKCSMAVGGVACTTTGVCGKDESNSALIDYLVYGLKGISMYADRARELGVSDKEVNVFTIQALFTTLTNVNFDKKSLVNWINTAGKIRDKIKNLYQEASKKTGINYEILSGPANFEYNLTEEEFLIKGQAQSHLKDREFFGETIGGLREMIEYGLNGIAAYADHAQVLGYEDEKIYAFTHKALNYLTEKENTAEKLLELGLELGEINLLTMELLDKANTGTYGNPEPTQAQITPVKGKAILVSGHDLKDLEELLKQTAGMGINIYTHGEMLPTLAYPKLKTYKHLIGNYGGAWQDQLKDFNAFPGAILMTTNCIKKPAESYIDRIFTTGVVDVHGTQHLYKKDFTPVIEKALSMEGFTETPEAKFIRTGFAHNTVLSIADTVIDNVKNGSIKHFFFVGGCDGPAKNREYYTNLVKKIPKDSIIMTSGCGKFRFNTLDLGEINGIPRLLDMGQCNDTYSAIKVAVALAEAFETDVNSLPLSIIVSWLEQKAVSILLTLLHLGIKNVRLGPVLPAFLSKDVLNILSDTYNLMPTTSPDEDLKAILGDAYKIETEKTARAL